MQAAEIMTREVATVAPCATTAEIATAMANGAVSDIPVCDADGTLQGMVSEDDLTRYVEHEREIWPDGGASISASAGAIPRWRP